jgi:MATE family multidrug resistance protein
MSSDLAVQADLVVYMEIRLLAAPAVLLTLAGFGALQGLQDMRTPLAIAATANLVNAALDPLLIFGWGPVPALGVAGAAWASTLGHWIAGLWVIAAVQRRLGLAARVPWSHAPGLFVVGLDLFLRTGFLMGFLLLATRTANQLSAEAGAAHQAARQMWVLTAFLLDSYATTAQSLVAYFRSTGRAEAARRVASVACRWGLASGLVLVAAMLLGEGAVARLLVPVPARETFSGAWLMLALAMPLNALSFVTDGIHWGTRDYAYLRNVMFAATGGGALLLWLLPLLGDASLTAVWGITGLWISVRAVFGVLRVWPGVGHAPLALPDGPAR